jgi:DNA-directed RNA polymerase specialized sigma24 family protein
MIKESVITQESFDLLLGWLDTDRNAAGKKYENIRRRLIRFYIGRGCFEAETLADEVINRVTEKLPSIIETYVGDPARYFYGVADYVHLEWLRKQKKLKSLPQPETGSEAELENAEYVCLEKCLQALPPERRELIVDYYREEKSARIRHRQSLALKLKISTGALQIKTSRIRAKLEDCIKNCVAENHQ